jgi:hypothetical protein
MGKLMYLMIHCTATPQGREVTSEQIRKLHTSKPPQGKGWAQVGYSDMIHLDGKIENLVPYNEDEMVDVREITNGALGTNGICRHLVYVGGVDNTLAMRPKDTRNFAQVKAMTDRVREVVLLHPQIKIIGHNQVDAKACPSFDVPKWCRSIGIEEKNISKHTFKAGDKPGFKSLI